MLDVGLLWSLGALQAADSAWRVHDRVPPERPLVRRLRAPDPLVPHRPHAARGRPSRLGRPRHRPRRPADGGAARPDADPNLRQLPEERDPRGGQPARCSAAGLVLALGAAALGRSVHRAARPPVPRGDPATATGDRPRLPLHTRLARRARRERPGGDGQRCGRLRRRARRARFARADAGRVRRRRAPHAARARGHRRPRDRDRQRHAPSRRARRRTGGPVAPARVLVARARALGRRGGPDAERPHREGRPRGDLRRAGRQARRGADPRPDADRAAGARRRRRGDGLARLREGATAGGGAGAVPLPRDDHQHRPEPALGRRHAGAVPQLQPRGRDRERAATTASESTAPTSGTCSSRARSARR